MKKVLLASVSAAALLAAGAGAAVADPCSGATNYDPVTGTLTLDATGCHLVINNPSVMPIAVTPVVPGGEQPANSGIEIVVRDAVTGEIQSDGGALVNLMNHNVQAVVDTVSVQGEAITGLTAITAQHSAAISSLRGDVSQLQKLSAMSFAMPDAYLQANERFSFAGGAGFAGDQTGFAGVGAVRFDKNWSGYGGVAFSGSEVAGKVGVRAGW